MAKEQATVKVPCSRCGAEPRNHQVVCEHTESWEDQNGDISGSSVYQVVKCMGCETIRFRQSSYCSEAVDWETGKWEEYDVRLYPDSIHEHHHPEDHSSFPEDVAKMYVETIMCFNAGASTLAGGGLRAIVEAICQHEKVPGKNLKERIDELVAKGYLAKNQADLLHEERYIGNDALHEMKTPSKQDLEDGLKIVEGLMNAIYVLPARAARLKARRATGQPPGTCGPAPATT